MKETKIAAEKKQQKFVTRQDLQVVRNAEDAGKEQKEDGDDHKLLVAIAYNVRKVDQENDSIVKALKQNNRYLHSILRHMKALVTRGSVQHDEE